MIVVATPHHSSHCMKLCHNYRYFLIDMKQTHEDALLQIQKSFKFKKVSAIESPWYAADNVMVSDM